MAGIRYDAGGGRSDASPLARGVAELAAADTVEGIVAALVDACRALVGTELALLVCRGDGELEPVGVEGIVPGRIAATIRRPAFTALARGREPVVVPDPFRDEALMRLVSDDDQRSAVALPFRVGDDARGLVVALVPDRATDDDRLGALAVLAAATGLAFARLQLRREVRARSGQLRSVTTAVPDPVLVVDAGGKLVDCNPAAAELFTLHPDFDVGRPIAGRLRSEAIEKLLLSGDFGRLEVTLLAPDERTYEARVRPGDGPDATRVLTLEDVTRQREFEKLQADFVAVIGHELRTPLTMIKGYAKTLASKGADLPDQIREKATGAISQSAERLERLIEDLLLISGIERGRPPLALSNVDLREVVEEVAEEFRAREPDRGLVVDGPERLTWRADAVKIRQVLAHLLDNAIKFSDDEVTVRLRQDGEDVLLEVVDRGQGIFSGDLPHLFDRFHQVDGTHTRAHGGTGVGLHIARTLIDLHGGRIGVRSALGRGSTFWVRLPSVPPDEEAGLDDGTGPHASA